MRKYAWSTIALFFGILSLVAGLANPKDAIDTAIAGVIIIFGAISYKSAKKRKLGSVSNSLFRKIFEYLSIVIIIALIVFQNDLKEQIVTKPVHNLIIPLWAIIAYLSIALKKGEQK